MWQFSYDRAFGFEIKGRRYLLLTGACILRCQKLLVIRQSTRREPGRPRARIAHEITSCLIVGVFFIVEVQFVVEVLFVVETLTNR
jgi:hypothetical protein